MSTIYIARESQIRVSKRWVTLEGKCLPNFETTWIHISFRELSKVDSASRSVDDGSWHAGVRDIILQIAIRSFKYNNLPG